MKRVIGRTGLTCRTFRTDVAALQEDWCGVKFFWDCHVGLWPPRNDVAAQGVFLFCSYFAMGV